jgi:fructosamine-3-kinase
MDAPAPAVKAAVEALLGCASTRWVRLGGSALNVLWRADAPTCACVKVNTAARLPMLEAEAAGLRELAHCGAIRVPGVLGCGVADGHAFLALEWLDLAPSGRDAALGRALAQMHRTTAPRFGWHRDNTIGTTPQANAWLDDWSGFFVERRLRPQLDLARANGHARYAIDPDALLAAVPALLDGHAPPPSLLHGDLWSGNAAALDDGTPVLLDPAVYYGDRETDLAMTALFGGFGSSFYDAYEEAWPLPAGHERRRALYNLYHVLNHLNLFGASYGAQAQRMIRASLDAAT